MQTKTKELTIEQLCTIKSQISLSNRSYIKKEQWKNSKRAEYLLKLLLNHTEAQYPIHLYVLNWDTFDITSEVSINNSHYIPGEPGIEELTAIYNYLGYYKKPELMYDLNEAKNEVDGEQLIEEAKKQTEEKDASFYYELLYHDNVTTKGLPTTFTDLSKSAQDRIEKLKVKVVFQNLPDSTPLNNDKVKFSL